ncbi:MAG: metalloregulator ArsR/SmtB family transcription factor [Clostridium perfringens]|nr:metalloregulator ArsR/SmtB family transcription factor [Clostridium perfringens]
MSKNIETCNCTIIHKDTVEKVRKVLPDEEKLYRLADFFKVFGDPTRMKILFALFEEELCVCDISALLNMTQSAVSHQLRLLKKSHIVKFRKEGKVVYYSLDDGHIKSIVDQGIMHTSE